MPLEYAESRIKEALEIAGGNRTKACQQLISWMAEDVRLLQILTRPHLNGIVAYNVERVASGRSEKARKKFESGAPAKKIKANETPMDFGKELLRALVGEGAPAFGLENGQIGKKRKASKGHEDALRQMARTKSKPRSSE